MKRAERMYERAVDSYIGNDCDRMAPGSIVGYSGKVFPSPELIGTTAIADLAGYNFGNGLGFQANGDGVRTLDLANCDLTNSRWDYSSRILGGLHLNICGSDLTGTDWLNYVYSTVVYDAATTFPEGFDLTHRFTKIPRSCGRDPQITWAYYDAWLEYEYAKGSGLLGTLLFAQVAAVLAVVSGLAGLSGIFVA